MTSIPLKAKTSECKNFRCIYLKNKTIFLIFFLVFSESALNFEHFQKKDDPHSLCISEISDHERHP